MNQLKIGKFISEQRKKQGLTQAQLAEKLFITDRAVSKWETGRAMPDSSIMLELCKILNISVVDLLNGEELNMINNEEKLQQQLMDVVKQKEEHDRMLLFLEWIIMILSVSLILIPAIIASYINVEEWKQILIIFSGFIPALLGIFISIKIEQKAGYYQCKHCKNTYVPTFKAASFSMHLGRTKYLKCPKCGKKSWNKKVLNRIENEE